MMKKTIGRVALSLALITGSVSLLFAWGTFGHQHINHAAVFALPTEMRTFFYNHIDFITEESTVPDLRKYTLNDKAENPRHYINIEGMETMPIDSLPKTMKDAMAKYDEKTLQKMGILPWYMQEIMEKLTKAFKEKRKTEILFLAADLGHYIGDANMPLHTALNHDGQLTDQKGIHSFFESQLPEYFGNGYNYHVTEAIYLENVTTASWDVIKHSNGLADSLLLIEKNLKATFSKEKIYKTDVDGKVLKNKFGQWTHSYEYATAYHKALNGMVEHQLRHAVQDVANFWFTAWVNAGKPDLDQLDPNELTASNRKRYKKEMKLYKQGKLFGFRIENEFN
ncbi:MAG: S1/P1 Nuclease [Ferruginibacter sp.]|nr:S1/P1 Nuclease [Ferruginibacter sp.]